MAEYIIDENLIWRDGHPIAVVTVDGGLYFEDPADEKYRLPILNELTVAGRVDTDGKFVYIAPDGNREDKNDEKAERPVIANVSQLCDVMAKMTGEAHPPFSKIYGDETDEVWSWITRHVSVYNEIAENYQIKIKSNRMEVYYAG